jgi:hypothetical protein
MIRFLITLTVAAVLFGFLEATVSPQPGPGGVVLTAASAVVALVTAWGLAGIFRRRRGHGSGRT